MAAIMKYHVVFDLIVIPASFCGRSGWCLYDSSAH